MSSPSPFAELARARGATLRSRAGLELPESFSPLESEYAAARGAAALFDLSFRSGLRFTGADRQTFLHNILSNDVVSLRPGGGCYATLLTQQSKVVSDGYVFCREDSLRLDLDRGRKDRAREHLEKFLIADDVEIDDTTEGDAVLGVFGPRSAAVLGAVGAAAPAAELEHVDTRVGDVVAWVARVDWTGDPGFELVVARSDAEPTWRSLLSAGDPLGLVPAGMAALDVLRLEAGIPWPGVDFDESHLVLEAGLERGISFTKGCYLGQEVVERASSRGHVNRRLVGLRIEGEATPPAGSRLLQRGAECGRITSAVFSPQSRSPIALGYVRRDVQEPGNRLDVEFDGLTARAEVAPLPFYRGSAN